MTNGQAYNAAAVTSTIKNYDAMTLRITTFSIMTLRITINAVRHSA